MIQKCIYENAHVAQDQESYQKKYDSLTERYETKKKRLQEVTDKISQLQSQKGNAKDFLKAFEKTPDALTEFSLDAFTALVDYITVYAKGDIRVTFRNGQEIKGIKRNSLCLRPKVVPETFVIQKHQYVLFFASYIQQGISPNSTIDVILLFRKISLIINSAFISIKGNVRSIFSKLSNYVSKHFF